MMKNEPSDIGTRWELMLDEHLVDSHEGVTWELMRPERRACFTFDAPWERGGKSPGSVFPQSVTPVAGHPGHYRMYYRAAMIESGESGRQGLFGVLESTDGGVTFTRPVLGLQEFEGSRENNLLPMGSPGCPPVFLDTRPGCPPEEQYKGLQSMGGKLYAMVSKDGFHWRCAHEGPLDYPGAFDTVNTAFWDSVHQCYRSFTRVWVHRKVNGKSVRIRCIQSATSDDFIHWDRPVEHLYADGEVEVQLYTNATIPCPGAEHILLSFPNRFMQNRWLEVDGSGKPLTPGHNDGLLMASRDGVHWHRYLEGFVRPGPDPRNWLQRCNYPVWGIAETSEREWSLYATEVYFQPDSPARVARIPHRPHGLVALRAGYRGGEILTRPILFSGNTLRLNYATSAAGSIQVEIQDEQGRPIEGFRLEDMSPLPGDYLDAGVVWNSGRSLSELHGKPVRLRFVLSDADLFAFRFAGDHSPLVRGMLVIPGPLTYRIEAQHSECRILPAPPSVDFERSDPADWDWSAAISLRPPDEFLDCRAEVALFHNEEALFVAARVADPFPLANIQPTTGNPEKTWSADALQIHLGRHPIAGTPVEITDILDIRLWYSTPEQKPGCCVILGKGDESAEMNPPGVQGRYSLWKDGSGFTLFYRLPWTSLKEMPAPQQGAIHTATIQCHWGNEEGNQLLCGAAEVRSDNAAEVYMPDSWGKAVFT